VENKTEIMQNVLKMQWINFLLLKCIKWISRGVFLRVFKKQAFKRLSTMHEYGGSRGKLIRLLTSAPDGVSVQLHATTNLSPQKDSIWGD